MSKILAPIFIAFEVEIDSYEFSSGLTIRKITDTELKDFFGGIYEFENQLVKTVKPLMNIDNFWDDFLAEEPIASLREMYVPYYVIESDDLNNVIDLLAVIRLIGGSVFCPKAFHADGTRVSYFYLRPTCAVSMLEMKNDDLEKVRSYVSKYSAYKNSVLKNRLIRCFDSNNDRNIIFIEAVSIVESIVCKDSKSELRYRFSLLTSLCAKNNGLQFGFDLMRKIYDIRSDLVHSGTSSKFADDIFCHALELMKVVVLDDIQDGKLNERLLEQINKFVN